MMMTTMMTTMMMMEHGTSKAFALVQIINWVKLVAHSCTSLQSPVANETEADVVDESLHTKGRQIDSNCTPWSFPVPPTVQPVRHGHFMPLTFSGWIQGSRGNGENYKARPG